MATSRAPRIGSFVLETLTTGMYTNPLDTVREYVQNAFDSIRAAERTGAIKPGQGRAEIVVQRNERSLSIRDNGSGIAQDEVLDRLLDIGMSTKSLTESAGFRGIGRLAGIAYCSRLEFIAHAAGEPTETLISHDCEAIRTCMRPGDQSGEEVQAVLDRSTEVEFRRPKETNGYFEVRMVEIQKQADVFLDSSAIEAYLIEVAPIPFDLQRFNKANEIYKWVQGRGIVIPELKLFLQDGTLKRELLKPYIGTPYKTSRENIKIFLEAIRFYPDKVTPDSSIWGWYAETDLPGAFSDSSVAGFRVRRDNIALGGSTVMQDVFRSVSESYTRFNNWFIGELHILDGAATPNARRDGFEDTQAWRAIRSELERFARERANEAYRTSQARNTNVDKLTKPITKTLNDVQHKLKVGLGSDDERSKLVERLEGYRSKLTEANRPNRSETERKLIDRVNEDISNSLVSLSSAKIYARERVNTALDRKQRKLLSEVLEILFRTLDEKSYDNAKAAIMERYGIQSQGFLD